jgi:hypothetical protein
MNNGKLVVSDQQSSLPVIAQPHMRLIEMAINNGADISQLEKLMDLQERYEANQAKKEFNAAMSVFQTMLPVIEKLGVVDYTTTKGRTYYSYAKLEDIAKAIQPALKATGLSYRFTQGQDGGGITVRCIVTHKEGHSEYSELVSNPDISGGKDQLKSIASAISYLRRYTLTGILGIVVGGEDDDGGSVQDSGQGQQGEVNCYPDEEFNKNYPVWSKKIIDKKHTVDSLHQFLTNKKIILSQDQYEKLQQVGK